MPGLPLNPLPLLPADPSFAEQGLQHARRVLQQAHGLPQRWQRRERFTFLDAGFGGGAMLFALWRALRADPQAPRRLHYVALLPRPFEGGEWVRAYAAQSEALPLAQELADAWPPLVRGFHRLLLDAGRLTLTLVFGDIGLDEIEGQADALHVDGALAPMRPGRLAAAQATLSISNPVPGWQPLLRSDGFDCAATDAALDDLLVARHAPRWARTGASQPPDERHAIVIGAGLAGSAACERLAARGWRITLLERHAAPAMEASGNLAGIVMPLLSRDDNLTSQLARAAYLFSLELWRRIGGIGEVIVGESCGVLQLAASEDDARLQRESAAALAYPGGYARWLDAPDAARLADGAAVHGGWLFPQGAWVHPASVCGALLRACGSQVDVRYGQQVARLQRVENRWQMLDGEDRLLASAPVVILANGAGALGLAQAAHLPLQSIRGQVTHVPADSVPALPVVICGDAYLTRPSNGVSCLGASYDMDDERALRQQSQDENIARLAAMLPGVAASLRGMPLDGRVGFRCVSADRLPLAGSLSDADAPLQGTRLRDVPRLPGLHALLAYGSRGLIWASYMAELLADRLDGDILPMSRDQSAALDPARFLLKMHRRGTTSR
ncbi:tRNA 5-methylaminomethyl-2-thiouridine biosynthesis bifunctional protein [Noviherbaspirillum humi]|uniref:tRNA 5-methylaminomethyl-2-thiouridine biosynthesis bifunctional protein MnmC n=1 Tax=Noviherbaspirillum humi TaxID=1688639 RepID=A0A239C5V3_9BURK|nr:FAD-dependent 5-carboxymethylaminomethyl-2-thiouridine(34) oxidoreductase MnmC [Noviherbaspirillum humi]SNS15655.1 tRNA 5-methylaminomethyl-2-thiouridine biosynthesis bifunctional protein [Noviherbaspirillum humi]